MEKMKIMINNIELLNKYKAYLEARKQSQNYANVIKHWLGYLEENKIETFTQETITQFFNTSEKYGISYRNLFIKSGRDYYSKFLQIPKEQNEWFKIKLIKEEYRIPDFMTPKDIEEAKKVLKTYFSHKCSIPKIEALIDFLFASGCRKAELLTLKREDIDLENNKAKVFGKGKKERYIYFNDKIKKEIVLYFKTEPETLNAFNITISKVNYMSRLLTKYLGKRIYTHLFRHSAGRAMLMKDIPLLFVSKILGHSSIQTTLRYTDPNEEMISQKYKEKMK